MAELTRQEMQTAIDGARVRIMERMLSRQDVQNISDTNRERSLAYMQELFQIHQQFMVRRGTLQQSETLKRIASLELRIAGIERDTKVMLQMLARVLEQQSQPIVMPQQADEPIRYTPEQRYAY